MTHSAGRGRQNRIHEDTTATNIKLDRFIPWLWSRRQSELRRLCILTSKGEWIGHFELYRHFETNSIPYFRFGGILRFPYLQINIFYRNMLICKKWKHDIPQILYRTMLTLSMYEQHKFLALMFSKIQFPDIDFPPLQKMNKKSCVTTYAPWFPTTTYLKWVGLGHEINCCTMTSLGCRFISNAPRSVEGTIPVWETLYHGSVLINSH